MIVNHFKQKTKSGRKVKCSETVSQIKLDSFNDVNFYLMIISVAPVNYFIFSLRSSVYKRGKSF